MKKQQFPPQKGLYILKVKTEKHTTHNWQDFDLARLQISVGQEYHEGEKIKATIDWCAPRFESVQICVNDTLQRFNKMFELGLSEVEAMQVARSEGQAWIDRYIKLFSVIPHLEIKRWDTWKNNELYQSDRSKIDFLYKTNEEFKQSIDNNIMGIWARRQKMKPDHYPASRLNRFFSLSKKYLLEEITVFSVMYETDRGIDIYPGTVIFPATVFQGRDIDGAPDGLGKGYFCRTDFSRNRHATNLKVVPE